MSASLSPADFLARWQHADGSELANYQLFVADLCALLGVPTPDPARDDTRDNAYVFERRVTFRHGDGSESAGRIDCYRRGHFVLEAKKVKLNAATKGFDDALQRARGQAEGYARALPAEEGRPPFLIVVDVGHVIELYADFTRSGATYTPFPDPRSHRIRLAELCDPADDTHRQRLTAIWSDPLTLDPTRASARVTREIADHLARVAKALEAAGHHPERVAGFLTRCLFSMFAEDVGLLPQQQGKGAFTALLETLQGNPQQFVPLLGALWSEMDTGGFSVVLRDTLPRFNGKLFKNPDVLPLDRDQIGLLLQAARTDWTQVEPAIFGTLLERALTPDERHALGAHYTPRAYVERLVLPTVIEPLREEWRNVQAAALLLANEGKLDAAWNEADAFHHRLCQVRVLDPACGSANFLYVTLEHMKRLEGEVLDQMQAFGGGQRRLEAEGLTVDPHQFLGLELNPRAAAIAELVLWIGYLQWHFRTQGSGLPPQPILKDFKNIECRDAVLAWDAIELVRDEQGVPQSRWDGRTTRAHPVTSEPVPDETARVPLQRYINPRKAEWPQADFIVGNPPYLGARTIRLALGDGYLEALRGCYANVPDNADYVMYWWDRAADLINQGELNRFGFITTNSIRQEFCRKVLIAHFGANEQFSLRFCIPDHPWVDASDGADVRVAMTVADASGFPGVLSTVTSETLNEDGEAVVTLMEQTGRISPALVVGADPSRASPLRSNQGMSCVGYQLTGKGFVVDQATASRLDPSFGKPDNARIRPLISGRDITQTPRDEYAIDLFGLALSQLVADYPALYQHVLTYVKPERDQNRDPVSRDSWWLFARARGEFRPALRGLGRVIGTSLTAKYRTFVFVPADSICDSTTVMFALDDTFHLGVLSSNIHVAWALAAGGRLGVGNDPRYNKSRCFEPFPFPAANETQQARIRDLAEQLDTHRKRQQAAHDTLTLTGMYNVLEKLRSGEALTPKEKTIHEQGLVSVLKTLHDELDAAVLDAYGWSDLAAPLADPAQKEAAGETLLERLVALNAERAAEEARGLVRWLRPEFQAPASQQGTVTDAASSASGKPAATPAAPLSITRQPWPPTLPEQVAAVARMLTEAALPLSEADLAARFTGKGPWKKRLPQIIETLEALGRVRRQGDKVAAHA